MEAITKKCSKCGEVKSLSAFSKDKSCKDGLYPQCKGCRKAYRKANAGKIAEYNKTYQKANADKIAEYHKTYQKAYEKANADKIRERKKAYLKACVDNLTSRYIASKIGLPISDIPPELIELKRTQLKLHRLIKQKTIT